MRIENQMERIVAKAVIAALLGAGYKLSVDNQAGDEENVRDFETLSTDADEVFGRMFATDEDYIFVFSADAERGVWGEGTGDGPGRQVGWVRFIYGNDGWDVINDYTTNLEPQIGDDTEVQRVIDALEKGDYQIVIPAAA